MLCTSRRVNMILLRPEEKRRGQNLWHGFNQTISTQILAIFHMLNTPNILRGTRVPVDGVLVKSTKYGFKSGAVRFQSRSRARRWMNVQYHPHEKERDNS